LNRIAKLESILKQGTTGAKQASSSAADGILNVRHLVLLPTSVFCCSAYLLHYQALENSEPGVLKVQPLKSVPKAPKVDLDRYLGSSLWMNLSDEASAIHSRHPSAGGEVTAEYPSNRNRSMACVRSLASHQTTRSMTVS
jgi:hypothetical protein